MSCIANLLALPNCIIDRTTRGRLNDSELKPATKTILKEINDSVIILGVLTSPDELIAQNEKPLVDTDIVTEKIDLGWIKTGDGFDEWEPSNNVMQISHNISPNFSTVILGEDDMFSKYTCGEKLLGRVLRNRCLLPLDDSDIFLEGNEEAAALLKDLKLEQGKAFPVTYNTDFNMETDESFSRIFFYGMGCVLLTQQEEVSDSDLGPFVVDMPYQDLKVRKLYREYGARVHFSQDQKVTGIHDYKNETLFKPGDDGWDNAKMLAKVTALLFMTVREHLTWTHLICSNDATRESTLTLAPNHPIRRLLTVFTYHATEVNLNAFDTLVPNISILHRGIGLEYRSTKDVFDMSFKTCNIYEPFSQRTYNPALQKLVEQDKMPFITQGSEFYEIVKSFVRSWLETAGEAATDGQAMNFYEGMKKSTKGQKYELPDLSSQDAMVNLLTSIIFTVTCYHELIGHVIDYTELPTRAGFRLTKENPSTIDLQSFLTSALICASTSTKMPRLMSTFSNFFGAGGAPSWEIDVWKQFLDSMEVQSKKVQEEDKKREVEFKYFDPATFECSVSL